MFTDQWMDHNTAHTVIMSLWLIERTFILYIFTMLYIYSISYRYENNSVAWVIDRHATTPGHPSLHTYSLAISLKL